MRNLLKSVITISISIYFGLSSFAANAGDTVCTSIVAQIAVLSNVTRIFLEPLLNILSILS
ncbi:hypothetical protein [Pseudoruminococcus massiliensis]|uniref:hypothetical protein n=1 Tax=Pseudoruminococcus massiliensis TaxID=2086583 RepID=UPI003FD79631